MVKARVLEDRLIKMYRQADGYSWIGGPGEEAFTVPLGLLIHKGQGPQYDYCHFHYRQSATLLAMGADPVDAMRQMKNTATDPYSGGRNFVGHYSKREWNVVPVSSPIEVQYSVAPGTAIANKRAGGRGITIVTGGGAEPALRTQLGVGGESDQRRGGLHHWIRAPPGGARAAHAPADGRDAGELHRRAAGGAQAGEGGAAAGGEDHPRERVRRAGP